VTGRRHGRFLPVHADQTHRFLGLEHEPARGATWSRAARSNGPASRFGTGGGGFQVGAGLDAGVGWVPRL
jgi:hypothetical protein